MLLLRWLRRGPFSVATAGRSIDKLAKRSSVKEVCLHAWHITCNEARLWEGGEVEGRGLEASHIIALFPAEELVEEGGMRAAP